MADDEDEIAVEGEEGGSKKGKKAILIGVLLLVLLGAAGAGLYFSGMIGSKKPETASAPPPKEGEAAKEGASAAGGEAAKPVDPHFYSLPEFLVNLNTGSTQVSFLKMGVSLQVATEEDTKRLEALQPVIVDDFNTYLRELRASDLAGSAGLERLREELLTRVNKATAPTKVTNILFKEIIVQ